MYESIWTDIIQPILAQEKTHALAWLNYRTYLTSEFATELEQSTAHVVRAFRVTSPGEHIAFGNVGSESYITASNNYIAYLYDTLIAENLAANPHSILSLQQSIRGTQGEYDAFQISLDSSSAQTFSVKVQRYILTYDRDDDRRFFLRQSGTPARLVDAFALRFQGSEGSNGVSDEAIANYENFLKLVLSFDLQDLSHCIVEEFKGLDIPDKFTKRLAEFHSKRVSAFLQLRYYTIVDLSDPGTEESCGTLMLFSDKPVINCLPEIILPVKKLFSAIGNLELQYISKRSRLLTRRSAIKSSIAAIMSRNMSHNIGSHVLVDLGDDSLK